IHIAVDILLPTDLDLKERIPAIMVMTRYWRSFELRFPQQRNKAPIAPRELLADDLVLRGFAMVIVDARGSGASTGVSRYPWTSEEIEDYGEVAKWAANQPWCNGNIGAVGNSYEGTTAQLLASTSVKAVKAVVPQHFEFDVYADLAFPGGIPDEEFFKVWSEGNEFLDSNRLPKWFPIPPLAKWVLKGVRPVDSDRESRTVLTKALEDHKANTNIYNAMSKITSRDDKFGNTGVTLDDFSVFIQKTAIESSGSTLFVWGSWLDGATADTVIRTFNTFNNPQIAIIGAWCHERNKHASPFIKSKTKPNPIQPLQWAAIAQFFKQTLKDEKLPQVKTLFYYTLGAESWKQSDTFPLPNTKIQDWYFHPNNKLTPKMPTDDNGIDSYHVDFKASTGRYNRWHTGLAKPVIYPDRVNEDVRLLTYTSAPLVKDIEITGYPIVTLYITSSEEDGSFFVYLEDIDESGVVRYITEGYLRGIHHKISEETPPYYLAIPYHTYNRSDITPLPKDEIVELKFGMLPTSVLIQRGHRIRIAIAGADRETFSRIPKYGIPLIQVSRNKLHASHIKLPTVSQNKQRVEGGY
ncbi:MAG: CocE/NonD family hydrolase, partial [Dehalococcoidia bacterium]